MRELCGEGICNAQYVDNNNIIDADLYVDGLHLVESGSVKLANNILRVLNNNWQYSTEDPNHAFDSSQEGINLLHKIRVKNTDNIIVGNLNAAYLPNKIDELRFVVKDKVDILILTETKLDDSYPTNQFTIDGFSIPYRQDRNRQGEGIYI